MSRKELILGLLVALALRVGFGARQVEGGKLFGSLDFEILAANLLDSGVYSEKPPLPTAVREPGYPVLIAGLYGAAGRSPWSVILGQSLLSAATVWLVYLLAAAVFDAWAGRFAFWACVFYPYFIYYSAYFFRETLLAFLVAAVFLLLVRDGRLSSLAGAGGLAGWMCLTNGALSPAVALAGVAAGWGKPWRWKRFWVFCLPVAFLVGVWVTRNLVVMRAFIPASSLVGIQMYWALTVPYEALGTEEQNRILGNPGEDTEFQRLQALPEAQSNKAFQAEAMKILKQHPWAFVRDCAGRFFGVWRIVPRDRAYTHKASLVRLTALLSDGWLIPLALLGLWRGRSILWVRWMAGFILIVTATYSISHAPIRYRVPVMPLVLVLAAGGAGRLKAMLRKSEKAKGMP
ncbi:MAG: glycosyltransferase family 39 protein [Elusimicrobia bacterium]|nr:glycosyltransferase family 39 protein [Elusimicrobiota bacterium]